MISGLVVVYCGFKIYLGVKVKKESSRWVELKDVLELEIQRTMSEDGRVMERPMPAPIYPSQSPVKTLRIHNYNTVIDVSEEQMLVQFYGAITKANPLVIPGLSL